MTRPLEKEKLDKKITYVVPVNPRQPKTEAHLRWCVFQEGRTLRQAVMRGARKRDVRRALRQGWIRLEGQESRT